MKKYCAVSVVIVICSCYRTALASITYDDISFMANLTRGYNPKIRPVFNRSEKTGVAVGMGLKSIISLDEKKEFISCNGWFSFFWTDKFLRWNVTEDTPPLIFVPVSEVWTPTVLLHNSVSGLNDLTKGDGPVLIFSNGTANYAYFGRTDTRCKVNIQKFPFDQQVCYIHLSTFFDEISGEYADVYDNVVNLDLYDENGEFHLLEATLNAKKVHIQGQLQEILEVSLTLKRRTTFYILNNILPVVFLSFLNTFAFLLPEDSGEKNTLCISILLSYAVFLTLINSYLPQNSDNTCFFSVYLTMLVLTSTLICLTSIFILALNNRLQNGKFIPRCVKIKTATNKVRAIATVEENQNTAKGKEQMKCNAYIINKWNSISFGVYFLITVLVNGAFFGIVLFL